MSAIADLSTEDRRALLAKVRGEYETFKARGLKLDMTRGKPAPDQLDLANGMLTLPDNGDYRSDAGEDTRNYGGQNGLPEVRTLFSTMLGAPPEQIVSERLAYTHQI